MRRQITTADGLPIWKPGFYRKRNRKIRRNPKSRHHPSILDAPLSAAAVQQNKGKYFAVPEDSSMQNMRPLALRPTAT